VADIAFLTERMRLGFGVDLVVDKVAAGLAELGHAVTVYASYEDGTYHDRPYRLEHFGVPAIKYAPLYDIEAARRAKAFGLAARGHELFLIETQPFFCLIPWLRDRAIAVDHGVVDSKGFRPSIRANFAFVQLAQQHVYFRYANRIITVSEFLRGELPARLRQRAVAIHNGADHYAPVPAGTGDALRRRLGVADDEVMLLYVGRLNPDHQPYKGTAELLGLYEDLRREHPRARLVMAGFGDDDDAAWVRAGGAIPYPNVPVDEMPALYAAADLFVTCSRWEGFNLNLAEAQTAGTPVIAYRVGAHPEVVDHGRSGLLVRSQRGFADALRELVRDGERRAAMGTLAAEWAARFRWRDAVAGYDRVISDALTRRSDSTAAGP
jgi:glycosyltransferase involved in cell wall biosynthesis